MTKNELIAAVADKAQMTKTAAATAVRVEFSIRLAARSPISGGSSRFRSSDLQNAKRRAGRLPHPLVTTIHFADCKKPEI